MSPSTLSLFWRLQLVGWGAFYFAMAFSRVGRFPLAYMLVEKLPLAGLGLAASLVLRRTLGPKIRRGDPLEGVVVWCVSVSYLLTMVWTALHNLIGIPIAEAMLGQGYSIGSVGALFNGTVYHAFALTAWGFLYIGIKHYSAWQTEREHALRAQTLAAEARLGALQAQLNPHFLFNSLNAVSTLVAEGRNDQASAMIAKLGDLLRASLSMEGAQHVSLAEELELVQRYLEIERVRFEDRLRIELDVAEEAYSARVPLMILQPIVENAVRHGIARLSEGGTLSISANVTERREVEIVVENPATASPSSDAGAGIGLANVRERLQVTYGTRAGFSAGPTGRGSYRVELSIPMSVTT